MAIIASFITNLDVDIGREQPTEDDYNSHNLINNKLHSFDLGLFQTKWFDYRHLTPFQATCYYIAVYGEIYRKVYSREIDRAASEFVKPITVQGIMDGLETNRTKFKTKFSACWRGRQIADCIGMPYQIYIEYAFQFRMRRWKQRYLPQPQHLYHEYDVEKIQLRWEELQGDETYRAAHPAFLVQNYQGTVAQNDYHEWLFAQANKRSDPAHSLAAFIRDDQLLISKVQARVSDDVFERVENILS